jgi:hypothetical protein
MSPADTRKSGEYVSHDHLASVMAPLVTNLQQKATSTEVQMLIQAVGQLTKNQELHSDRMERGFEGVYSGINDLKDSHSEERVKLAQGLERCKSHEAHIDKLDKQHKDLDDELVLIAKATEAVAEAGRLRDQRDAQAEKAAQPRRSIIEAALGNILTAVVMGAILFIGNLWVTQEIASRDKTAATLNAPSAKPPAPSAPQPP